MLIKRLIIALLCLSFVHCTSAQKQQTFNQRKDIPLKNALGINAFEWDFEVSNNPAIIDEKLMDGMKSFKAIRHYMDWEKLESVEGRYTFNPTASGGWNYDAIYARCKKEGIEVLPCLKTIPSWIQESYPLKERDAENVPVRYGKSFSDPKSYVEQAKVAFQFVARYGSNISVDNVLLSVYGVPRWTNDPMNVVKKGLGLIHYIECDNERDKWWKGAKAHQSGSEYAANLSAFYDGHKNSMGPGVGVKNADPSIKVVMAGLAKPDTNYVIEMINWCKKNRGMKADGTVNLCWDVINYHLYSDDDSSSQENKSTRGVAPEMSAATSIASSFMSIAHKYASDMPVWISETGYDINQSSPLKAVPIGNKTTLETQADWILRSALLYIRNGLSRVFFYQVYDENPSSASRFASCGLLNKDHTRKPAADYLYQVNRLMGTYKFVSTLSKTPFVDRYQLNGKVAYVLVKPSENGSSVNYTLNLPSAKIVKVYQLAIGKDEMSVQIHEVKKGMIKLRVTETPIFVLL